ncbi:unnamed protein product [Paramecium sonneborni]|uniref:Uncharacterized protein n=1 Tax=Paramecium sonneborni TaxID=65129 RepID=A0A8S1PVG8_9CILI|nr:unnamed protein product [Paramecium sonneborni]
MIQLQIIELKILWRLKIILKKALNYQKNMRVEFSERVIQFIKQFEYGSLIIILNICRDDGEKKRELNRKEKK